MKKDIRKEYRKQRELMHKEYLKNELQNNQNMSVEEKELLFNFLKNLKYGINRIKEVLSNIWEISRRDNIAVKNLVEGLIERKTIEEDKIKQEAEEIRKIIFKRRFPETSKAKELWNKMIVELDLPKGLFIEPPHNFEGDNITLKIRVSNINEYNICVNKLKELGPEINKLLDILIG